MFQRFFPPLLAFLRLLWALPCSLVGLALGAGVLLLGGQWRRVGRTLEFSLYADAVPKQSWCARQSFGAITFGHVIVGSSATLLACVRSHELVHVRQYERWGPLFFLAYPASSLIALLRGQRPYWDNVFEVAAYHLQDEAPPPAYAERPDTKTASPAASKTPLPRP